MTDEARAGGGESRAGKRTSAVGSPSGSDMARDVREGVSRQAPVRAPRVLVTAGGEEAGPTPPSSRKEATASSSGWRRSQQTALVDC